MNKCSYPKRYCLHSSWHNQFKRCFSLHRLPAGAVWSAGVPRPRGGAAVTSQSGRAEQPTGGSRAERDGLLPNHVLLPGVSGAWKTVLYKVEFAKVESVGLSPSRVACWVGVGYSH